MFARIFRGRFTAPKAPTDNLTDKLLKLGKEVQYEWPNINYGGCCVFAAIVAGELVKKGIPVQGFVAAGWFGLTNNLDEVRPKIKTNTAEEWQNNGVYLNHIGLEFRIGERLVHYDTSKIKDAGSSFDSMDIYHGRLTVDELKTMARARPGWNPTFRRSDIPAIRKHIKQFFKEIKGVPA